MTGEILGIYTESMLQGKVVLLRKPIVRTTTISYGMGFTTEVFNTVLRTRRRLKLFGRVTSIPLPSKKEPFRYF